ncbi:Vacuolar iron transporter-like protein 1 [Forsythia ovata]|uniref:Vacuolar iron transporter n=1 Tax=Forsythia ovata TaxID=205694 RepID=A0ABD1UBX5_9LAMI
MAADASSEIKISIENEEEKKMIELIERGQWLRAAILGANDGLLSTTSLMLGVGAAKKDKWLMIISGLAGAVAGFDVVFQRVGYLKSVLGTLEKSENNVGGEVELKELVEKLGWCADPCHGLSSSGYQNATDTLLDLPIVN